MAQTRDLYEVLGIQRDASADEVRRAFRRLARQFHPDVNSEDPDAEQRFKEINLAYETLSDPSKRRQYDLYGGEGFTPDMFSFMGDWSDVFEAFFGTPFGRPRGRRSARGQDLHVSLPLSFAEAAFGARKEVTVDRLVSCASCSGTGSASGTSPSLCPGCRGSGQVSDVRRSVFGTVMTAQPCPECRGRGQVITSPCGSCEGAGRVRERELVAVDVPPGVDDGMELRMEGGGSRGPLGAPPGDLLLALEVEPHPVFRRRGEDLVATLEVPMTQVVLGAELVVETLDSKKRVQLQPGTPPGSVLRISGAGVPRLHGRGRGDLFLDVAVAFPEKLSKKERELVERLADARGERTDKKGPGAARLRKR